jgi:hypothetical protein
MLYSQTPCWSRRAAASRVEYREVLATTASGLALLADAAPGKKDVVIATLGASAALGGLVLVFLGTVIAAYQSIQVEEGTKTVRNRTRNAGAPIVGVFLVSLASVALAVIWLNAPGGDDLYTANFVVFLIELFAIAVLAIYTALKTLK